MHPQDYVVTHNFLGPVSTSAMFTLGIASWRLCISSFPLLFHIYVRELGHISVNSLAPGKFELNYRYVIFEEIWVIDGWGVSCEIALILMSVDFHWWSVNIGSGNGLVPPGNKPLPEKCWPRYLTPYGVPRPRWVKWIYPSWRLCFSEFHAHWLEFVVFTISNGFPMCSIGNDNK